MKVVREVEKTSTNSYDQPIDDVKIADSGVIEVDVPFVVDKTPAEE